MGRNKNTFEAKGNKTPLVWIFFPVWHIATDKYALETLNMGWKLKAGSWERPRHRNVAKSVRGMRVGK